MKRPNRIRFPDFIIIGAAKSGTTSLYYYVQQHPQVRMAAIKEPRFFAFKGVDLHQFTGPRDTYMLQRTGTVTELDAYLRLFEGMPEDVKAGEASPAYLYFAERASQRMVQYVPDVKLIAMLRDPVERAYSHYLHMRREGHEPLETFEAALEAEALRKKAGWEARWFYAGHSGYAEQLTHYYAAFPREQIRVYLYEDLKHDALAVMQDLFEFIGVDASFVPNVAVQYSATGIPRNQWLHGWMAYPGPVKSRVKRLLPASWREHIKNRYFQHGLVKPPILPETRRMLQEHFKDDVLNVQDVIDRDLVEWLK